MRVLEPHSGREACGSTRSSPNFTRRRSAAFGPCFPRKIHQASCQGIAPVIGRGRLLLRFSFPVKHLISTLTAMRNTLKAIILSGGQGLRLRPLTDDKPKPLIPVNGRPISEHQIEWLRKNPAIDGIVFACGYRWEKLKDHFGKSFQGLSIDYSVEEEPLGTGGDIERETFPKLVPYGEITSFPYYGNWWYVDSMKDLQEVEVELKAKLG